MLDAIDENLGVVRKAPDDREAMTTIRRGFHTLKGSSRMVGLNAFGEAAWAFEQMMNHWLSEDKDGTTPLFELIQDGANFFRSWCEQLQAAPRRVLDASLLTARCNAFPDKPAAVPAAKPVAQPAAQPVAQPVSMPAAQPAAPSVAQPAAKPAVQPEPVAARPAEEAETLPMLSLDGEADTLPMPEVHAPELPTLDVPSLDEALSAGALPASRADGFSQSHNFASVSRSMAEGDLRQSLEGFLDDASHRQADMPVADLASLHSDPVRPADSLRDEGFESQQDDLLGNEAFEAQADDEAVDEQADLDAWSNAMSGESADFDSMLGELPTGEELTLSNVEAADLDLADAFMVPADFGEDEDIPLLDMGSAMPAEKPTEKPVEAAPVSHDPFDFNAGSLGVETKSFATELPSDSSQEEAVDFEGFQFDDEPVSESAQPEHEVTLVAEQPVPAAPVSAQPAPASPVVPEVPVAPSAPAPVAKVAQPEPQESMVRIGDRLVDAELFEIFNAEATQARMRMNEDWQDWHASDALRAPEPLIRAMHTLVGTSRHVGLVRCVALLPPWRSCWSSSGKWPSRCPMA
ncbi:Hpt domain-containing protein [Lautropia mirabilis]